MYRVIFPRYTVTELTGLGLWSCSAAISHLIKVSPILTIILPAPLILYPHLPTVQFKATNPNELIR